MDGRGPWGESERRGREEGGESEGAAGYMGEVNDPQVRESRLLTK